MTVRKADRDAWLDAASPAEMKRLLEALYRVEELLAAVSDLDRLLDTILVESKGLADAEGSSILLYDEAREDLYFQAALSDTGDTRALRERLRLKLGEGIAGEAAAKRASIRVEDARIDSRFHEGGDALTELETRSLLAAPMLSGETLVGVLEVVNKRGGFGFTDFDEHILEMFSALAGVAVNRARLIEANTRAAELAAVGEAVAGLSHYTKNILMGLNASIELVDRGMEHDNDALVAQGWPVTKRSVARLSNVVEDMLAFSRHNEPYYEACEIGAVIEEAVESFRMLLSERNIDLDVRVNEMPEPVRLDHRALHRCLLNLLTNAADAAPNPGGRVEVEARPAPNGALIVSVSDNGPGVPEKEAQRIFNPFYSTKGGKGTGLGLAVTAKIVRDHNGSIRVERSGAGGARFVMELPARQPEVV